MNIWTKEVMSLNLKLKSSSVKSQSEKIESELEKLKGLDALEKLKIMKVNVSFLFIIY